MVQARRRVAPAVEAVAAVRWVRPPAARRPSLLEKVAADWCCARGEVPPHGRTSCRAAPRWRRRVAGDTVESTEAVDGVVLR